MTSSEDPGGLTYRDSGVDIEAGDALVEAIKPLARATIRRGAIGSLGGFGSLFDPRAAGFTDPILVATTDGVGTKLRLAIETGIHDTVGIDLVAMCVNDLIVQGAEPLFFLDYFATGHLDRAIATRVIAGISEACRQVGCTLSGGETAEMPGMYRDNDYDLAGFAVGAVERGKILPDRVLPGDMLLGLPSTGVHSNGFSLVRRILDAAGLNLEDSAPFSPNQTLGAAFMQPTALYVRPVLALARAGLLRAAAHITGGGLPGNLPRILPGSCAAELTESWPVPQIFHWLARTGCVDSMEMLRVFNCGIGMVLVIRGTDVAASMAILESEGFPPIALGRVADRNGSAAVRIPNAAGLFR